MENKNEVDKKMKKLKRSGIIWLLVFLLFIFLSSFERINACGIVDSKIIIQIVIFGSFILFLRAVVLSVINKKRELIIKSGVSDIIIILIFAIGTLVLINAGFQSNKPKGISAFLKSDLFCFGMPIMMFYDENNRYPNNLEELTGFGLSECSTTRSDIVVKNTGDPNTWYVEASYHKTEKRFPCKDVKKVIRTIGYYCSMKGTNQECYFKND